MKLNKIGAICFLAISTAVCAMPALADLTIHNNKDQASTSRINGGFCSTILGTAGITQPHSTNVISKQMIDDACWANTSACKADVFMNSNCSGSPIGVIFLNTDIGISSTTFSAPWVIESSAFEITISKK